MVAYRNGTLEGSTDEDNGEVLPSDYPSAAQTVAQKRIVELVSAAGPLCNLCIAFFAIAVIVLSTRNGLGNFLSLSFFHIAALINIVLFLFNLLPIPPLDGFHVLSELFPELKPFQNSPLGLFGFMILFMSDTSDYLFKFALLVEQSAIAMLSGL